MALRVISANLPGMERRGALTSACGLLVVSPKGRHSQLAQAAMRRFRQCDAAWAAAQPAADRVDFAVDMRSAELLLSAQLHLTEIGERAFSAAISGVPWEPPLPGSALSLRMRFNASAGRAAAGPPLTVEDRNECPLYALVSPYLFWPYEDIDTGNLRAARLVEWIRSVSLDLARVGGGPVASLGMEFEAPAPSVATQLRELGINLDVNSTQSMKIPFVNLPLGLRLESRGDGARLALGVGAAPPGLDGAIQPDPGHFVLLDIQTKGLLALVRSLPVLALMAPQIGQVPQGLRAIKLEARQSGDRVISTLSIRWPTPKDQP